ncbi:MAG: hypothetical protein IT377_28415 [Polyangiaceae bacterium]|nr:hypothetical protein [Polyangiaceae bacterium]
MTRRFPTVFAALLALSVPLASPNVARAQDDATIQMARERFQEGVKFYDNKQYDKARAAFLQAYALKKHPAVLLNLAQSELRSAREADAAKHFAQYMRENKEASAAERQEAERGLATAKASVGELRVNVVDGAEVYVDGNLEGRSPLGGPVYLKPGSHNLEARKDGKTAASTVTAIAGQTGSVDLGFGDGTMPAAPLPPPGAGAPGAGAPPPSSGPTPMPPAGPAGPEGDQGSGKPGFLTWAKKTPLAWVGGGVAVLGLAGGAGFALASSKSYDDADSIRQQILTEAKKQGVTGPCGPPPKTAPVNFADACSKYNTRVEDGDSQKTWSTVSFVVAGVAAAGTVAYYFIDTGSNKASIGKRDPRAPSGGVRAAVVPLVDQSSRGLGLVGQF